MGLSGFRIARSGPTRFPSFRSSPLAWILPGSKCASTVIPFGSQSLGHTVCWSSARLPSHCNLHHHHYKNHWTRGLWMCKSHRASFWISRSPYEMPSELLNHQKKGWFPSSQPLQRNPIHSLLSPPHPPPGGRKTGWGVTVIPWVWPLPSNSDHQDYYIFSRESL